MKDRLKYVLAISGSAAMLGIGRVLTPNPRGIGTHEQLGLPPCMFLKLTGIPCPSCGLTTSVAYAAHLQFSASFVTQPFGLLIALIAFVSIPVAFVLLVSPSNWALRIPDRSSTLATYVLIAAYGLAWIFKISHMHS